MSPEGRGTSLRHAGGAKRKVLAGSYRVANICGTADQNPIVI
jgi:hypothetical protein